MSATNAGVESNGPDGLFAGVAGDSEAMLSIARHIVERALDPEGKATPEADIQMRLRSEESRGKILDSLLHEMIPFGISPAVWAKWLSGGDRPFAKNGIKPPVVRQQSNGKSLARGTNSVRSQQDRVERARAAVRDAQLKLDEAEDELAYREAIDKSLIEWSVTDHLVRLVSPIFAMGPAWTLMRAISSRTTDKDVEQATSSLMGKMKEDGAAKYRAKREAETEELLEALDYFSGYEPFEKAVRSFLLRAVREYAGKREAAAQDGRKVRGPNQRKMSAHPKAQSDSEAILEGLARKS